MSRPIDIPAIERHARQLRAEEMQRLEGLFAERLALYGRLLGRSLLTLLAGCGDLLRPLFAWNPQAPAATHRIGRHGLVLLARLDRGARALFSWNPQHRHSC